jgi:hypothetical protein
LKLYASNHLKFGAEPFLPPADCTEAKLVRRTLGPRARTRAVVQMLWLPAVISAQSQALRRALPTAGATCSIHGATHD